MVDEVKTAEQLVEFYELRLAEAEERLGAAIAARDGKKALRPGR
jgi:hypothetical protein